MTADGVAGAGTAGTLRTADATGTARTARTAGTARTAPTADAAVIGDGVVGASVACHLAAAGASVVLLSRGDGYARSATSGSAGQIRMHHGDPDDARLAALSADTFAHWAEAVGGDCGFRRTGFAFLVDEEYAPVAARTVTALRALGVDTDLCAPAELAAHQPDLDLREVAAVAYEPGAGHADPDRTTRALLDRVRALGGRIHTGRSGSGAALRRDGDRVVGATLDGVAVSAGCVVVAAGAGSAAVCAAAGVGLEVDGRGRESGFTSNRYGWAVADTSALPGGGPACMVIDDLAGTYFRPDGPGRVLFRVPLPSTGGGTGGGEGTGGQDYRGESEAGQLDGPGGPLTPERLAEGRRLAARRLPGIAAAPVLRTGWAREACTADGRALIGPVPHHPGLYLATAFNGGGFKSAPAVGAAVAAELVSGGERPELAPYRPARFATGHPGTPTRRYRHM